MTKKILFVIFGLFLLIGCQQNNSGAKTNSEAGKKAEKSIEVKFSFENFTNTIPGYTNLFEGKGIKISIKNATQDPQEVMLNAISLNGSYSPFYVSTIDNTILEETYTAGNLVLMGGSEENLWVKPFVVMIEGPREKEIKYPAILNIPIRDIKSGKVINQEIIFDKDGKILFEKASYSDGYPSVPEMAG